MWTGRVCRFRSDERAGAPRLTVGASSFEISGRGGNRKGFAVGVGKLLISGRAEATGKALRGVTGEGIGLATTRFVRAAAEGLLRRAAFFTVAGRRLGFGLLTVFTLGFLSVVFDRLAFLRDVFFTLGRDFDFFMTILPLSIFTGSGADFVKGCDQRVR